MVGESPVVFFLFCFVLSFPRPLWSGSFRELEISGGYQNQELHPFENTDGVWFLHVELSISFLVNKILFPSSRFWLYIGKQSLKLPHHEKAVLSFLSTLINAEVGDAWWVLIITSAPHPPC